jgi:hypothetical protein
MIWDMRWDGGSRRQCSVQTYISLYLQSTLCTQITHVELFSWLFLYDKPIDVVLLREKNIIPCLISSSKEAVAVTFLANKFERRGSCNHVSGSQSYNSIATVPCRRVGRRHHDHEDHGTGSAQKTRTTVEGTVRRTHLRTDKRQRSYTPD